MNADATFDGGVQEDGSTTFALGFIGRRAAARRHQEVLEGAVEMLGFALMAPEAEDAVRHHAAFYLVLSLQIYSHVDASVLLLLPILHLPLLSLVSHVIFDQRRSAIVCFRLILRDVRCV